MSEKICLILHRKSADRPEVKEAVKAVSKMDIPLRVRIPWNKKDKPRVVQEALDAGAERIISGGGDGTINATVDALVGKGKDKPSVSLGVLPLGTANDFARGIGLPADDLTECLRIACTAPSTPADVGRMNKRNFINVASLGIGAEITATTPQDLKKMLGGLAYTIMGLAKAFQVEPYQGRLLIPEQDAIEGKMLIASVGNCRYAGGAFDVAPLASLNDGKLDLFFIGSEAELHLPTIAAELKNPLAESNKFLTYRQLSEFTIETERPLHCNLDGEPVAKRKLKFSVLPKHIGLAVPKPTRDGSDEATAKFS